MAATADVEVEAMLLFPHISLRPGLPQAQEGGRHGGHGGRRGGGPRYCEGSASAALGLGGDC